MTGPTRRTGPAEEAGSPKIARPARPGTEATGDVGHPDGTRLRSWQAPLRAKTLYRHWHRARAAVGLPAGFRMHDFRHTAHTLAAVNGATTRELMHRMGHASPAASLRYQHATQDRDAALAKTLGDVFTRGRNEPSETHHAAR